MFFSNAVGGVFFLMQLGVRALLHSIYSLTQLGFSKRGIFVSCLIHLFIKKEMSVFLIFIYLTIYNITSC